MSAVSGTLQEIPSSVSDNEATKLAQLAAGKVVLEVGSWYGRSTIALASTAERVHAVDWHQGDPHAGMGDSLLVYAKNLIESGLRDKIITHVARIEDIVPLFTRGLFDGCFIDAFHTEKAVLRDFGLVSPLLKSGAWVAFHDYGVPQFGVTQAVDKLAGPSGVEVVDTLAVLTL